jgi:thioredoxin 1
MKNNKGYVMLLVLVIVGILAVVGGIFFYFQKLATSDRMQQEVLEDSMEGHEGDAMMEEGDDDSMMTVGNYVVYTPQALEDTAEGRRVLFFYANWCPICGPADADFKKNVSQIPDDVTLIRVNYNDSDTNSDEEALAQKYGVTYQHTFVQIGANGEVLTK